jgi:hypothetical protein
VEPLAAALTAFIAIAPVELPDKTFVATLVLSTRYRPLPVWLGVVAAFALQCLVAVTAGTLLAPHRLVADVVFVAVTMAAVYVRRFGPRGFALGMAGFMPYFFTQFLQARPAELPWLLVAAVTGLGATLLLRGYVFAERDDRTLARLLRAFRAHVHGLVVATAALLAAAGGPADRVESALRDTRRRRTRSTGPPCWSPTGSTGWLPRDPARRDPAPRTPVPRTPTGRTRTGPGNGCWTSSWPPSGWPSPRAGSRRSVGRTAVRR